ncbi:hypothetical protein F5Y14DRAFT_400180 [Nemania sp. NC0429]|nr:hypothetical protein F5Y14DRAFT_400180 [Nemania sp. NC0429]
MTIESNRPTHSGRGSFILEDDVLASLWENAPFPKLPSDAPPEIRELVVDVESPRRVYTIHRASRRHNLQILIDRFVLQLRHGCGSSSCSETTCFTYRKRAAGKSPIRRYNPNSARTLAVYLAGQDNPESRLCPYLQPSGRPSDAIAPLQFGPKNASTKERAKARLPHTKSHESVFESSSPRPTTQHRRQNRDNEKDGIYSPPRAVAQTTSQTTGSGSVPIEITERPVGKKDYRSFAAALFGTVAFKMLEWLAPNNVEALSDKMETARCLAKSSATSQESPSSDGTPEQSIKPGVLSRDSSAGNIPIGRRTNGYTGPYPGITTVVNTTEIHTNSPIERTTDEAIIRSPKPKRRPNAKIRTSSGSRSSKVVMDAADERLFGSPDAISKSNVRHSTQRSTSQLRSEDSSDTNADSRPSTQTGHSDAIDDHLTQIDGLEDVSSSGVDTGSISPQGEEPYNGALEPASELDSYLPQSLARLNLEAVNFLCDVLQDDLTMQRHMLEPPTISGSLRHSTGQSKVWKRKRRARLPYSQDLKYEWKLFVEQSIFHVLSDPQALLESFTTHDGVVDSQTVWYCMLRLTRVAPHLVFDSLWIAMASLFVPPKSLQTSPPTAKVFATSQKPFSNTEAASLMSICFHALIAAAPLVTDSRDLLDMSRNRSRGVSLSGSGTPAGYHPLLTLQYEDAFTDDLALRLARRLLMAVLTRRDFDELIELDLNSLDSAKQPDVLDTLLSQIEPSMQSIICFSKSERSVHEKRVPILLLDWARTVMVREWTGKPDVPGDGSFGGALMLIRAMYRKRQALLLGDAHFRFEFLGDRLDSVDMPVSWLSFTSTRQKVHLLDFPFLFKPASLVTYFRAINFSMMSHSYEEATSFQLRIRMTTEPGNLATEAHHRSALEDLLRTPASKFLILNIRRDEILADAFDQLWRREERELLRPLKIHLGEDSGEEGYDYGGVQQEFFRLAIAEALDPDYGAFTVDSRTRMTWFQPGSLQPEWKYELIGLLVSLAVYNGLTLPVTFPKALYQKLLGEPITELHHIADGWPDLANGLTSLLEWNENDGAVEDVFVVTYEFSTMMLGQPVSRQMDPTRRESWPQPSSHHNAEPLSADNPTDAPPVTGDNRSAYVSDYIRYLTDVSIAPQFEAFARGFRTCLQPKSLTLLTPSLLQSIVEGTQEIDISELRRVARYSGWDANHRTIRDFWSVVKKFDDRMRRKLLEFVTSSDRLPVGGAAHIQFVIQKNGEEEGEGARLPTAYTCYGHLLLPEYRDKDVLRERLSMAVENAEGFGFA